MTQILDRDNSVLREVAKPVPIDDIASPKIQEVLQRMKVAMRQEEDGVALAAPQIGESLRIFVVRGGVTTKKGEVRKSAPKHEMEDLVFINPKIINSSKKKRRMEEGCLSIRWLYGEVLRSEKVTIEAYNEKGILITRGASGLLAQIFQHEIDHLEGILFTDKATNVRDLPPPARPKIVFFGSMPGEESGSRFSTYVMEELESAGLSPILEVASTRDMPSVEELRALNPDIFVVASFGKILSKEILDIPQHGCLNVHPSLLPKLRGPAPIQESILQNEDPGVSIIKMNEKMDAGETLIQARVAISPWPDHYRVVEEKLGRVGGSLLSAVIPEWLEGKVEPRKQDDKDASYTKMIKKEDGLLNLNDSPEKNWRKVLAYSSWPGAYMMYTNKRGKEVRVVVRDAKIEGDKFVPTRVIPAGKKEMDWVDFLRGN